VPINGSPESWTALDQAILVARNEKASLQGLHIVPPGGDVNSLDALLIQTRFDQICKQANAGGYLTDSLTVVAGKVPNQICHHAQLADLVVLNVNHPPQPGVASVGSGLRAIIWRAARPVLTVRAKSSPMDRALLAFNGSEKSKEALFAAVHLAEHWNTSLTILTITDGEKVFPSAQDYARAYLEQAQVRAEFLIEIGPFDLIMDVVKEHDANLIVVGGYNGRALKEVMQGSAVNFLLREAECPLLICR